MITSLAVSPDGRHLAWTVIDSSSHIWQAPLSRDRPRPPDTRALTEGTGLHYSFPAPSTGGRVAIVGSRHGVGAAIYTLAPDGAPVQLTADAASHTGPQWMPGERELAMVADHGQGPGFWAADTTTRRERMLFALDALSLPAGGCLSPAAPAANIAIAPDFSRLAMSIVKDGVPNLWLAPLRDARPAGPLVQRTAEREAATYPQWSPDGRWIAYQCAGGTDTHVCIIGADAGGRVQLTDAPGQSWIGGWSPDSSEVIFAARRAGIWNVATVSRLTSRVRALTTFDDPGIYVRYPRWDQAAARVLFERSDTRGRVWTVEIP
jgi:Tol biopolymer transport system component